MLDKKVHRYKVAIVGDAGVGKTSLITRYTTSSFCSSQNPTIGVASISFNLKYEKKIIPVDLWDTAGQERFRSLIPMYIRNASLVLIVLSMNDLESFEHLNELFSNIREEWLITVPIMLCANKIDVENQYVSHDEVVEFAESKKCEVIFTSAKDGTNVDVLFEVIAQKLYEYSQTFDTQQDNTIELAPQLNESCC